MASRSIPPYSMAPARCARGTPRSALTLTSSPPLAALAGLLARRNRSASFLGRRSSSLRRLHHLPQLLLEVADLVTETSGELELQLGGRGPHLVGQLLDQRRQLGAGQAGDVGGVLAGLQLPERRDGLARACLDAAGAAPGLGAGPGGEEGLGVLVLAGEHLGDVGDLLPERLGVQPPLGVVRDLLGA